MLAEVFLAAKPFLVFADDKEDCGEEEQEVK